MKEKQVEILLPEVRERISCIWKAIPQHHPRLIVMLGKMHGVCCVMCGHYEPTVKAWNRARRGQA